MNDDEEFIEGCPDCRNDTVVETGDPDVQVCTNCGWRSL